NHARGGISSGEIVECAAFEVVVAAGVVRPYAKLWRDLGVKEVQRAKSVTEIAERAIGADRGGAKAAPLVGRLPDRLEACEARRRTSGGCWWDRAPRASARRRDKDLAGHRAASRCRGRRAPRYRRTLA